MAIWFWWETLDDAERALEGPNPAKGLRILRRLAARGNVEAQYRLGLTFEYGQSDVDEKRKIKRDFKQAACWYKQAADNGHHRARDQLWQVYLKEGHHVDEERALTYLLSAAKKGVANAQRFLGTCYMKGNILPVPKDYAEGLKWLRRSAKAGDSRAQMELAEAYRDGTGVDVDLVTAYVWFSMAARRELVWEQKSIERHKQWNIENPKFAYPYEVRKGEAQIECERIAEQLSKSDLIKAQRLAAPPPFGNGAE